MKVQTIEGKPLQLVGIQRGEDWEHVKILTGKQVKPDFLFFAARRPIDGNDYQVAIQGLYRGHYCDSVVSARALIRALTEFGAILTANRVQEALNAWLL